MLPEDFDLNNIQSMGLNLVLSLVKQLKGNLFMERSPTTSFKLTFASEPPLIN
jgi:two-component system, chemotaxis family, CheB/CheR fusion protein